MLGDCPAQMRVSHLNIEAMIERATNEWTLSDFQAIATAGIPESQKLEFKADFEQGNQERWRARQDQITSRSRDALAGEIVAFANAFGGVLLLGICEARQSDGIRVSAGLGDPIPAVAECADRLESSLRDVIDPPLALLDVRPIKASDDGSGFLVIKVPQSLSAPHGVGRPAQAFVRRGASCEPMTMRDLQHVFWEARTAIDRVNATFDRQHKLFEEAIERRFISSAHPPHLFYRVTVVPARSFQIPQLPQIFGRGEFQVQHVPFQASQPTMLTFQAPRWRPVAGGVLAEEQDAEGRARQLTIWTDGTIELSGIQISGGDKKKHYPAWYAVGAVWCLFNSVLLRRHFGRVDVPLLMECEIRASKDGEVIFAAGGPFDDSVSAPRRAALTDRLELGPDSAFDEIARMFAEQIGWACGLDLDFSGLQLGSNFRTK